MGPDAAGLNQIEALIKQLLNVSVPLSFVALFVILVWGGIRFLTSGGEKQALQSASQTVTWALLGMLFLIIAWLVLQLVQAFTGVAVTEFNVHILCPDPAARTPLLCP